MENKITGNFSEIPEFYVYLHRRNDTNEVFYVGKGKNRRAWSKGSRNKHWKHITEKHGYIVEMVFEKLTEKEAFDKEIEIISEYGLDNLVNLTIGGNTSSGYRHLDETRQKQSELAKNRFDVNIQWRDSILKRIHELNSQQKEDPSFYKKLGEQNSVWYNSLTKKQKNDVIDKKTQWLKDPVRKAAMLKKLAETRTSDNYKENLSNKAKDRWARLTPEQREIENHNRAEGTRKSMQYRTGVLSTSTTYLVNRQVLVPSITKCSDKFGSGIVAAIHEMHKTNRKLTIFKGFVFEVYDKELHTHSYDTDTTKLVPLKSKRWNLKSTVKASDGRIFLSISEAANSFGDKKTDSTADWISRCMRNNRDAMGLYWSRPTIEECEEKILSLLKEERVSFE